MAVHSNFWLLSPRDRAVVLRMFRVRFRIHPEMPDGGIFEEWMDALAEEAFVYRQARRMPVFHFEPSSFKAVKRPRRDDNDGPAMPSPRRLFE